jgi:prolyl oligopeptidase
VGGVDFILETQPSRERTIHMLRGDRVVRLELPNLRDLPRSGGPSIGLVQGQLVFQPMADWNVAGRVYPAGAVLTVGLDALLAGKPQVTVVVAPDERTVIYELGIHNNGIVVELLRNVRSELHEFRFAGGRWNGARVPSPELGVAELLSADPSGLLLFKFESFLQPPTLYARLADGTTQRVVSAPEACDTSDLMVEQLEAKSRDGTRVPYFVIRPRGLAFDGSHPTLLVGYGGYGIAQLPRYAAPFNCGWGKRGGVHVVSNIRGGGEFGPAWHRAGTLQNRQNAFDDFLAVAEDLVRRKITSPRRLGIRGSSNGGTLMGAAVNQRPDLFGAVVATVPVFDLKRHPRMGGNPTDSELGNPDNPEHWAFMSKYSPYHNVSSAKYPPVLIISNRRDDRVPVGNARKMVARLEEMGHEVLYHESAGGGHVGETLEQAASEMSLALTFLLSRLQTESPPARQLGGPE